MTRLQVQELNQLLEDYTSLEYILIGDLRDLLEEPANSETFGWLSAVLDALLDTLPREQQLREAGGYLNDVLEEYPNWSNQVDRLKTQQQALHQKLYHLRISLEDDRSFMQAADDVRRELQLWMHSLQAHHRQERRLVQAAFTVDVGTGD